MRFPVDIEKSKDRKYSVAEMLSMHNKGTGDYMYRMRQAFRTAGESCKVFDENKTDVIVRYDEFSNECILNLSSGRAEHDLGYVKAELNKLKPYTVSMFEHEMLQLKKDNMVEYQQNSGAILLNKAAYNSDFGVSVNEYGQEDDFMIN